MKILGIDLAANYSSIALQEDDEINCFTQMHNVRERPSWDDLFTGIDLTLPNDFSSLDAIAFANGPGSYTALRNVSTFLKPIAFVHKLPLIPISSLKAFAMASYDFMEDPSKNLFIAVDAQKGSYYFAGYTFQDGIPTSIEGEQVLDQASLITKLNGGYYAGTPWKEFASKIELLSHATPNASSVCKLASLVDFKNNVFDPADANPIYLEPLTFKRINE